MLYYDSLSQILDRVVRNLEYLNDMTNGELDDCDDISKLKIQVKSIKNLIGVDWLMEHFKLGLMTYFSFNFLFEVKW